MTVIIRKMKVEDVPSVTEIDRISFTMPWPEHAFRYEVTDNRVARCFVAQAENDQIVAAIVSWLILDELHIATIATHPDFRRQGIAASLLAESFREAAAAGVHRAFLEVRAGNDAAQAMYRKFGFKNSGRRPKYYKDNGEDAILMTLEPLEMP